MIEIKFPIKFGPYFFTKKEGNQIAELFSHWTAGSSNPINRRRYTDNVIRYSIKSGLIEWRCKHDNTSEFQHSSLPYGCPDGCKDTLPLKDWRLYPTRSSYDFSWKELPPEIFYIIARPIIAPHPGCKTVGYSITKRKAWQLLNIWCSEDTFFTDRSILEMMEVLNKLALYRYIIFLHAGSVWEITEL